MAPSFNCPKKIIHEDGSAIVWNEVEKPKAYDAWLEVLATLMKYWGITFRAAYNMRGKSLQVRA